jgi:hypothetical protein
MAFSIWLRRRIIPTAVTRDGRLPVFAQAAAKILDQGPAARGFNAAWRPLTGLKSESQAAAQKIRQSRAQNSRPVRP